MNCNKCGSGKWMCPVIVGVALGLTAGFFMLMMALMANWCGICTEMVAEYGRFISGYEPGLMGGLIGGMWGFVKGFLFGFIFILFYNLLSCIRNKYCKKSGMNSCATCGCATKVD